MPRFADEADELDIPEFVLGADKVKNSDTGVS
jgi:hypothetical protein